MTMKLIPDAELKLDIGKIFADLVAKDPNAEYYEITLGKETFRYPGERVRLHRAEALKNAEAILHNQKN